MRNREGRVLESGIDQQCDRCGYQIATARPLPRCPMCGAIDRSSSRVLVRTRREAPA